MNVLTTAISTSERDAVPVLPVADLKVLGPVVVPITVDVVHGFSGQQCPPELLGHHESMLKDVTVRSGVRMLELVDRPVSPADRLSLTNRRSLDARTVADDVHGGVAFVPAESGRSSVGNRSGLAASAFAEAGPGLDFQRDCVFAPRAATKDVSRPVGEWVAAVGASRGVCVRRRLRSFAATALTEAVTRPHVRRNDESRSGDGSSYHMAALFTLDIGGSGTL